MHLFCTRYLLMILLLSQSGLLAQTKDSLKLACLLDNAIESAPEKPGTNKGLIEVENSIEQCNGYGGQSLHRCQGQQCRER